MIIIIGCLVVYCGCFVAIENEWRHQRRRKMKTRSILSRDPENPGSLIRAPAYD